jgi:hypothetical protein
LSRDNVAGTQFLPRRARLGLALIAFSVARILFPAIDLKTASACALCRAMARAVFNATRRSGAGVRTQGPTICVVDLGRGVRRAG